jgi:hypothetical protein
VGMMGRKPADRPTVTRHKPTVDWTDVNAVPFSGPVPDLPDVRTVTLRSGDIVELPMPDETRRWWSAISAMPHCVLWHESDWQYALDTALVHAQAIHGVLSAMAELRLREKTLGTTVDARRDLRIRYVPVEDEVETVQVVDELSERRKRLLNA